MRLHQNSSTANVRRTVFLLTVLFTFTILTSLSCSSPKKEDPTIALFVRTVESCVCNYLDIEDDNPSGLTYEDFIEDCNKTVRESHPDRFTDVEDSEPEMNSLRCPEKVESWLAVIAEQERLRENNRRLMQELLENEVVEDESSNSAE